MLFLACNIQRAVYMINFIGQFKDSLFVYLFPEVN